MNVGRKLVGFCNGYFGRDDYSDKIIIYEGKKWIVCKYVNEDSITCLNFESEEEKNTMIDKWEAGEDEE